MEVAIERHIKGFRVRGFELGIYVDMGARVCGIGLLFFTLWIEW